MVYAYDGLQRHFVIAFCCGTVVFAVCVVLSLDPWWNPRYLRPIGDMLLGNQQTSLCANAYLKELYDGADRVSLRLGRGASWVEAAMPSLRQALVLAMTPTLNSMSVMGGQMLGGHPLTATAWSQSSEFGKQSPTPPRLELNPWQSRIYLS